MNLKELQLPKLVISIVGSWMGAIIGSIFTSSNIPTWYNSLNKPSFAPPGSVIGLIWSILYTLMGIAAYLVWREGWDRPDVRMALYIFIAQLIFNILWSAVFFGLRAPLYAFFTIIFLWLMVLFTIKLFYGISKLAAWLLVPYIIWITIAGALNLSIYLLN